MVIATGPRSSMAVQVPTRRSAIDRASLRRWVSVFVASAALLSSACGHTGSAGNVDPSSAAARASAEAANALHCDALGGPNPPLPQARIAEQRYLDVQQKLLGQPAVTVEQAFPRGFDAAYHTLAPGAVAWMAANICANAKSDRLARSDLLREAVRPENLTGTSISAATGLCALLAAGGKAGPPSQDQVMHTCPQFATH